jgi:hypothetical protein
MFITFFTKAPPLGSILTPRNTAHAVPSYFFKIVLCIIIPYISRSCKLSLYFMVSLHNTLRRHLYLLGLSNSPLCRWCEAGEETSAHVLCECEALASRRHAYLGSFWSQEILRILTWGPSGTTARLQGSHDSIWGTKGLSYLRPRCIGAERPRTHMQSNLI